MQCPYVPPRIQGVEEGDRRGGHSNPRTNQDPLLSTVEKANKGRRKVQRIILFRNRDADPCQEAPPVTDSIKCKEPGVVRPSIPIHPSERLRKAIKDGYPPLNSPCDPFRDVSNSNCQSMPPSTVRTIILLMRPNAREEVRSTHPFWRFKK